MTIRPTTDIHGSPTFTVTDATGDHVFTSEADARAYEATVPIRTYGTPQPTIHHRPACVLSVFRGLGKSNTDKRGLNLDFVNDPYGWLTEQIDDLYAQGFRTIYLRGLSGLSPWRTPENGWTKGLFEMDALGEMEREYGDVFAQGVRDAIGRTLSAYDDLRIGIDAMYMVQGVRYDHRTTHRAAYIRMCKRLESLGVTHLYMDSVAGKDDGVARLGGWVLEELDIIASTHGMSAVFEGMSTASDAAGVWRTRYTKEGAVGLPWTDGLPFDPAHPCVIRLTGDDTPETVTKWVQLGYPVQAGDIPSRATALAAWSTYTKMCEAANPVGEVQNGNV